MGNGKRGLFLILQNQNFLQSILRISKHKWTVQESCNLLTTITIQLLPCVFKMFAYRVDAHL